uniref:F-box domain-containing protein n=1 Tax=Caenorhabditis tropicalis TaxID=1561998 RepID=A0A1I7U6Q2_9PELO
MSIRDVKEAAEMIYWNNHLMEKILGNVDIFKDRNSLELCSRRLRYLCLIIPITRLDGYAIRLEADPNWPAFLTLLMRPRKFSSRLTVSTLSDTPEADKRDLVTFNFKDHRQNSTVFFEGVFKRLRNQITEFEIKHRRFSMEVLRNIEQLPNLNRVIVKNARNFSDDIDEEFVDINISDRIQSLELILDRQWCTEIEKMKRLIGPNLRHFCCHVNPIPSKNVWFIEEIMVEMAVQNVRLDQCQLVFPDHQMPQNLIVAFTQFMAERSQIMEVFVSNTTKTASKITEIIATVDIEFRDEEDNILQLLADSCPSIFQKAEIIRMTNPYEQHYTQLTDAFSKCWTVRELHISRSPQNKAICPIDQILLSLPSTVKSLHLINCKLTTASIEILTDRGASTIQSLQLSGCGSCNTVQNFNKLLGGLRELKTLDIDMTIPYLLFPKIIQHSKLESLIAYTNRSVPENSLKTLRQHFDHVQHHKIDRHKQQIIISKPSRLRL